MSHLGHGGCVCRSRENDLKNLFSSPFFWKDENTLTHCRNSKYNYNQGGRTGPHESSDISKREIPKLPAGKRGTD